MRSWKLVVTVVLVLAGLVALPAGPASAAIAYPTVMASAGDSITRAYDATLFGCFLSDCTQYSWSTGTSSSVNSEYRRIHAANPAATASDDAKTGAKMADLAGQLGTAATQGAQYVTVLMGANDVCTKTIATMTPTATVQSQFDAALHQFFAARPDAHVFVGSIPDVYQLWSLLHTNSAARSTWSTFGICQSMLASSNTEAQRQQVVAQEQADNAALAAVCATYAGCLWDGLAIDHYAFKTSDVSTVDYFHPSVSGQNTLAGIAWSAGYWGP